MGHAFQGTVPKLELPGRIDEKVGEQLVRDAIPSSLNPNLTDTICRQLGEHARALSMITDPQNAASFLGKLFIDAANKVGIDNPTVASPKVGLSLTSRVAELVRINLMEALDVMGADRGESLPASVEAKTSWNKFAGGAFARAVGSGFTPSPINDAAAEELRVGGMKDDKKAA